MVDPSEDQLKKMMTTGAVGVLFYAERHEQRVPRAENDVVGVNNVPP